MSRWLTTVAAFSLLLSGCSQTQGTDSASKDLIVGQVLSFTEPVAVGNPEDNPSDPYIRTGPNGKVYLSWTEEAEGEEGRNVFLATLASDGKVSGEPRQMNDQFGEISSHGGENLAKFTIDLNGGVAGIWMKPLPEYHTGEMRFSHADPDGVFSAAATLNNDSKAVNHAFSTITTGPDGKVYAAWIDGRNRTDSQDDRQQMFMSVSEDGGRSYGENHLIASGVCPCCRPNIAFLDGGETLVVSHRFVVKPENVRNHVLIRSTDGGKTFSEPVVISDDGWTSEGCPHAGTSMTADSRGTIHSVWWTGGRTDEEAGIYYTHSEDGGQSFLPRQLITKASPKRVLHTQVRTDSDNTLYAVWVNIQDEKPQIFLAHRRTEATEWSPIEQLSDGTQNALYPMLAIDEDRLYVSWTEKKGETSQVRVRTALLSDN
ncbi:MAG: sialidase family protein [Acidobacteriota bacterium]